VLGDAGPLEQPAAQQRRRLLGLAAGPVLGEEHAGTRNQVSNLLIAWSELERGDEQQVEGVGIDHTVRVGNSHRQVVADQVLQRGKKDAALAAERLVQAAAVQAASKHQVVDGGGLVATLEEQPGGRSEHRRLIEASGTSHVGTLELGERPVKNAWSTTGPPLPDAETTALRDSANQLRAKPQIDWDDARARELLIDGWARDAYAFLALLDGRELTEPMHQAAQLLAR